MFYLVKKLSAFNIKRLQKNDHIMNPRREKIIEIAPDFFEAQKPITSEEIKIKYPQIFQLHKDVIGTISSESLAESLISVSGNISRPDRNKLKIKNLNPIQRIYLHCEARLAIAKNIFLFVLFYFVFFCKF